VQQPSQGLISDVLPLWNSGPSYHGTFCRDWNLLDWFYWS